MNWNKVNDVHPPFEYVLVYCPLIVDGIGEQWGDCVLIAKCVYYDKCDRRRDKWEEYGGVKVGMPVTHWMPLPEPPKE